MKVLHLTIQQHYMLAEPASGLMKFRSVQVENSVCVPNAVDVIGTSVYACFKEFRIDVVGCDVSHAGVDRWHLTPQPGLQLAGWARPGRVPLQQDLRTSPLRHFFPRAQVTMRADGDLYAGPGRLPCALFGLKGNLTRESVAACRRTGRMMGRGSPGPGQQLPF